MNQDQKQTIREFTRIFKNEHNVDAIDPLFAPDFRHNFRVPLAAGLTGFKDVGRMMNTAFPDVCVTEEELLEAGDRIVERSSAVATHLGPFMGVQATGKRVRWTEIHIYRLRAGQIAEHWVELSMLELLEQIRPTSLASMHEIRIGAAAVEIFKLLTTQEGLRAWWTDSVVAKPEIGHVNRFGFANGTVEMPFRVDRSDSGRALVWTCVQGDRVPIEWVGTRIVATLARAAEDSTRLQFSHEAWQPGSKSFPLCNTTWGELMHRLRDTAEGEQPGPHFRTVAP